MRSARPRAGRQRGPAAARAARQPGEHKSHARGAYRASGARVHAWVVPEARGGRAGIVVPAPPPPIPAVRPRWAAAETVQTEGACHTRVVPSVGGPGANAAAANRGARTHGAFRCWADPGARARGAYRRRGPLPAALPAARRGGTWRPGARAPGGVAPRHPGGRESHPWQLGAAGSHRAILAAGGWRSRRCRCKNTGVGGWVFLRFAEEM
jgi:hypothetical protein